MTLHPIMERKEKIMFVASEFQKTIFDFVESEKGNGIIEAVAGSGKTTTIVKCLDLIPSNSRALFVAFNRSIVAELTKKVKVPADIMTLNALGFRAFRNNQINTVIETKKLYTLYNEIEYDEMDTSIKNLMFYPVKTMVDLARSNGICPKSHGIGITPDTKDNWMNIIRTYNVDFDKVLDKLDDRGMITDEEGKTEADWEDNLEQHAIELARLLLMECIEVIDIIDFNDQLYLPVVKNLKLPTYNYVFVDETQDLSPIQFALIRKAIKPNGRIIVVGDTYQCIYGWRGAMQTAMDDIKKEFNCTSLPLSITYRCPLKIVREAQLYVPHIMAASNAKEGEIIHLSDFQKADYKSGDLVLCRINASLFKIAFHLVKKRIPVVFLGKDFGAMLIKQVEKLTKERTNVPIKVFTILLDSWYMKQIRKAEIRKKDKSSIVDKYDSICEVIESAEPKDTQELIHNINYIFNSERSDSVILSSIHRAKGLEADTVYILNNEISDYFIEKNSETPWIVQQERNLRYVAVTRTKRRLIYIKLPNKYGR